MTTESTAQILGQYGEGRTVQEAVAWFDDDGRMRVLVADMSGGRRIDVRKTIRGTSVTYITAPAHPDNDAKE